MPYFIQHAFAGVGAYVWHWGFGVGMILICLALAYFTTAVPIIGPWLKEARKDLLWAAFGIAVFLAGQWLGAHDANRRHVKQQVIIENTVDNAVTKTKTPRSQKQKDPWDRPEY